MDDVAVAPARHRLDVDTYHRIAEAGIFGHEKRIELIDGDLIDMAPIGQSHAALVNRLMEALFIAASGRAIVSGQNPVLLDGYSEPRPDAAVLRRRADFYETGERPGPADVLLLVEVADGSLGLDRAVKLPLYARAGIAEYWIVNVPKRRVEIHRRPEGDRYVDNSEHGKGEEIALSLAPEIVVRLDLLLG